MPGETIADLLRTRAETLVADAHTQHDERIAAALLECAAILHDCAVELEKPEADLE